MRAPKARAPIRLALTEKPGDPAVAAPWIGPLVALGARASRYLSKSDENRQLVLALSVPQRHFAAVLIGAGWVMSSEAPVLVEPLEVLRYLEPDTPVRVVTRKEVIADRFRAIDEAGVTPRIRLSGSQWQSTGIHSAAVLEQEVEMPVRMPLPRPGPIAQIAHLEATWEARLASPNADLAIIGTAKWLQGDLAAYLIRDGETPLSASQLAELREMEADHEADAIASLGGTLADLLLPAAPKAATWFTRVVPSARISDHLPLSTDIKAAILDGSGAIKYVAEVEAPIVICILDRSVADETAAEMVVQLRNSRGEPISLGNDLRWQPPAGVEALGFTVPL